MNKLQRLQPLALCLLFPLAGALLASALYPWAIAESKKPHAYTFIQRTTANGVILAA